ncbi:urease accessory protein UreE [Saccharibacter sp. 17.LH.SD]|uniref:urease accessory protein UreE n=1 Tax=Saccharibacter sp. 17.LH.SD TaxID=2689393 RepID=UPI0013694CC5|nr:urease accessory protein UreE [Saccharibacter sp. 17.LH.SD]MXV44962.1 urease accessory protein UreE [Saccharibacter sp. 17.LH.SD]
MRVVEVVLAGKWDEAQAVDQFRADYEGRYRRRMVVSLHSGKEVLLDLPQARHLRAGDGLRCDDGRLILVEAEPEDVVEITAADSLSLMRLAWHLGNRHCPTMVEVDRLLIRRDPVLEDMLRGLGGHLHLLQAGFDPEGGAYESQNGESASHGGHHHHTA